MLARHDLYSPLCMVVAESFGIGMLQQERTPEIEAKTGRVISVGNVDRDDHPSLGAVI